MTTSTKLTAGYILFLIVYLFVIIAACASCSTTKKVESSVTIEERSNVVSNSDSAVKKKVDSVVVKKDNSVTTIEKSDDYEKETVIEFDTSNNFRLYNPMGVFKADPADYFPIVAKITIREKGTKKEKTTEQKNTYDSASVKTDYIIVVTTTTEVITYKKSLVKNKQVVTSGPTFWQKFKLIIFLIIGFAVIVLGWYYRVWSRLWLWWLAILKRFKRKEDYDKITHNKKYKS